MGRGVCAAARVRQARDGKSRHPCKFALFRTMTPAQLASFVQPVSDWNEGIVE
jgi:hypothetical protein